MMSKTESITWHEDYLVKGFEYIIALPKMDRLYYREFGKSHILTGALKGWTLSLENIYQVIKPISDKPNKYPK